MQSGWCKLLSAVFLVGCNPDNTIYALHSKLVVLPESLDFGEVVVGESSTQDLTITNSGAVSLNVAGAALQDGTAQVISFTLDPVEVAVDESITVPVTFTPTDYQVFADTLLISSDDPDSPTSVPVTGLGVGPDIDLETTTLDFGDVAAGVTSKLILNVSNVGGTDLVISQTDLTGSGAFVIDPPLDGTTVSPDLPVSTIVYYTPVNDYGDSATFTISSNDPDEPTVAVSLLGNGGGDGDYPIAVMDCPGDVAPGDTVHFDASTSYDPDDAEPLTWSWSTTAPSGSTATLASADGLADLLTDVAGDYTVRVTVTNANGVPSAPAKCTVSAIPVPDIYVELVWDAGGADLDLHLAQDDAAFYSVPGDVSYCNDAPDWGVVGGLTDDPVWGGDDEDGYGPEHISIEDPADGDYEIRAHYFEDEDAGDTYATVRFYIRGVLTEETRLALTRNDVWDVGTIRWPYGYVVLQEDPVPTSAEHRSCWTE